MPYKFGSGLITTRHEIHLCLNNYNTVKQRAEYCMQNTDFKNYMLQLILQLHKTDQIKQTNNVTISIF